jgi:hypothetical protein
MKTLTMNDLLGIAGGTGKSDVTDGLLVASVDIPPHVEAQVFGVSMFLNGAEVNHKNVTVIK